MKTSIAIIIVSYQAEKYIDACLRSLLVQTHPFFKIVIVDNHSSDHTREIIVKYQSTCTDVHLIENNRNLGFAKANNIGMRYALQQFQSPYLFLLNQDTVVEKDLLEKLLIGSGGHKNAVFGPKILIKKNRRIWWIGTRVFTLQDLFKSPKLALSCQINKEKVDATSFDAPLAVDAIVGCAVLIPAKILKDVGYLDESFFMYGEDLDYSLRLKKKGYALYMLPEAIVYHDVPLVNEALHDSGRQKAIRRYFRYFIGSLRVLFKHFPPGYILTWLARVPFAIIYEFSKRVLKR